MHQSCQRDFLVVLQEIRIFWQPGLRIFMWLQVKRVLSTYIRSVSIISFINMNKALIFSSFSLRFDSNCRATLKGDTATTEVSESCAHTKWHTAYKWMDFLNLFERFNKKYTGLHPSAELALNNVADPWWNGRIDNCYERPACCIVVFIGWYWWHMVRFESTTQRCLRYSLAQFIFFSNFPGSFDSLRLRAAAAVARIPRVFGLISRSCSYVAGNAMVTRRGTSTGNGVVVGVVCVPRGRRLRQITW